MPLFLIKLSHVDSLEELFRACLFVVVQHVNDVFVLDELRELSGGSATLLDFRHAGASRGQLGIQLTDGIGGEHLTRAHLTGIYGQVELILKGRHEVVPIEPLPIENPPHLIRG